VSKLERIGGVISLYQAAAYVAGILFYLLVVDYSAVTGPVDLVAVLARYEVSMVVATIFVYLVFGVLQVVLSLALLERLKSDAPVLAMIATAFGLVWAGVIIASGMIFNVGLHRVVALSDTDPAGAGTAWVAINAVFDGLGGGNEMLGALWTLLLSWAALRTRELSKALNCLGLLVGAAGIVSVAPPLAEQAALVFGLTQTLWFIGLGIVLLRSGRQTRA
jgi:hypothetical protein